MERKGIRLKRTVSVITAAVMSISLINIPTGLAAGDNNTTDTGLYYQGSGDSKAGERSYSSTYTEVTTLDSYNNRGTDGWRNGLVTGNGENGVIDSSAPGEDVMIFQNMKFGYPTNAIRVTPDMSSVREEAGASIVNYNGSYLSAAGAQKASDLMTDAASKWVKEMNLANSWNLQNTYAFHPGHQLRLSMTDNDGNSIKNGTETEYRRYTDYQTAEIGAEWTDKDGDQWERKTFASRENNVNITSMKSTSGAKLNMTITVDDIARMSNEAGVATDLSVLRYRKIVQEDGDYIGWVAHYPYYHNSTFNNAGFAGVTRVIVVGDGATKEYTFGTETADTYKNPVKGDASNYATDAEMNLGYDKEPEITIKNADAVYLITKTERDLDMGTLGDFKSDDATAPDVINGTKYSVSKGLIDDTAAVADKYSSKADYSDFDYEAALAPSKEIHSEIFNRLTYSVCTSEEDIAMRSLTNEELIAKQKESKEELLPAMLERLFYNGRFANVCSSGIQAPRLGGMWTGAWGCEWSGDYTTDANINLQIAGANIGSVKEETIGFINVMLKNVTDWELNAKQVYGIENAILAPTRTDGYSAVLTHFNSGFPGQMWLSGASWLILPMYEYYQCYGDCRIELTPDIRAELERTDNKYAGYTEVIDENGTLGEYHDYGIKDSNGDTIIYNLRNTLGLSDERAEQILQQGYLELKSDILSPLLTKCANFWKGFLTPEFYTKDGKGYYEDGKTELEDGGYYLITPGYSPENQPANTRKSYTSNAVMDIASTRDAMNMAIQIEKDIYGENDEGSKARIAEYEYISEHLPPYLYESTGELKEWALSDYKENFGHRHGSQLYGVWPGYEGETDPVLFEGATKLIEKKNSINEGDSRSGHGWLHRGIVMARLKNGEGVRNTLLPLTTVNMIYNSMMMAHNNDMTAAYCTDPVITIPAIQLESLVYSDSNVIELLPAMLPEIASGGTIGGTVGITTRNGGTVSSIEWSENSVTAKIKNSKDAKLKLSLAYDKITVNGSDVTDKVVSENGSSYYVIETDDEITVQYDISDVQDGSYTISSTSGYYKVFGRTEGEWEPKSPPENAFDGQAGTAYDGQNGGYCGVQFYEPQQIKAFRFMARSGNESRMAGSVFQVSENGIDYTTVYTVTDAPSNGTYVSVFADDLPEETRELLNNNKYKYFRYYSGASSFANIAEIEVFTDEIQGESVGDTVLDEGVTIWADNIVEAGGNHQGSSGDTNSNEYGEFQGVTDELKLFFPDASDGAKIGSLTRLNGLDSGTGEWAGYIETTITAPLSGVYTMYILCSNGSSGRGYQVTNTTNSVVSQITVDDTLYSTKNYMKLAKISMSLDKGDNVIRIKAPDGMAAPDFLALNVQGLLKSSGSVFVWAQDVVDAGGNHQGSAAGTGTNDFGTFKNVDDTIKRFFPDAVNGGKIGTMMRLDGLDNSNQAQWKGYVEVSVDSPAAGNYELYFLCNTNTTTRSMQITNTTNAKSTILPVPGNTIYSSDNGLQIVSGMIQLDKGKNTLKFQAPEGAEAPNFIAVEIVGIGEDTEPDETPMPTAVPTPVPTAVPTPAPTAAPTATPTAEPTLAPDYEIISKSVTVNDDGTSTINSANVRVKSKDDVALYTAVYDSDGNLVGINKQDIAQDGESTVDIGITADSDGAAKMFLWRGMEPLTEVEGVSLNVQPDSRIEENFNRDWLFTFGDVPDAETVEYDDSE